MDDKRRQSAGDPAEEARRKNLSESEVHELELDVNAPEFALAMANRLHELIGEKA